MMRAGKSHAGRVNLTKYVKVRGDASETCLLYGNDRARLYESVDRRRSAESKYRVRRVRSADSDEKGRERLGLNRRSGAIPQGRNSGFARAIARSQLRSFPCVCCSRRPGRGRSCQG